MTGATAAVTVTWISDSASCDGVGDDDDVCWTVDGDSFSDTSVFNTGAIAGVLVAVTDECLTQGSLNVVALPTFTHSMVAGELGVLVIGRDIDGGDCGGAADDDFGQDADLLSVRFCYEVDNVFSGE